jgi:hypothetical protein
LKCIMVRKILLLWFIVGLTLLSGCTQTTSKPSEQGITTNPTIIPSSEITTVSISVPTINPPTIANINATSMATADSTDVSQIQFTQYSDNDFSMDYPSTWNVSKSTYTSYFCNPTVTYCYQNEVKTIGPFNFKEDSTLKKPSRMVTFTSADGKQKIVAFTSDFLNGANGNIGIDPNIQWIKNRVTDNYPDVAGSAVGDYQYAKLGGNSYIMSISYSVTMPVGSEAYPLAYKMKNFFTLHHSYEFAFISDNENIQKYRNLEERIFSTITPNDIS